MGVILLASAVAALAVGSIAGLLQPSELDSLSVWGSIGSWPSSRGPEPGRGKGHHTLWCGTCSAEDHRDTRFYEPPHQVGYSGPVSGWMTQPDAVARRRRRPGRRRRPRADQLPGYPEPGSGWASFFWRTGRAGCIVWPAPEFVRGPDAR